MSFAIVAAVAAPLVIGGIQMAVNNKKARDMEGDLQAAQGNINRLLANREPVYDASGKIRAMKESVQNPFANLSVATQAAEIQAEEADIALANTLDTARDSGLGSGGATALAQAAARSKKDIAASIETQEAQNNRLRAQGEQQKQQQLQNLESQAISAEERASAQEAARDQMAIDRAYGESDFLRSRQMGLQDSADAAMMAGISGATSVLSSAAAGGAFNSPGKG